MKIENIHIEGFGVWHDCSWESLEPGLNVFHGPNETGKSTMMAFVRSILFGFDRRGSARRYEPLKGGTHGGWLDFTSGDRRIRVERRPGRHVRGTVLVTEGDQSASDDVLDKLLGGTTRTLYHNVFAFGLEELEHFHNLQDAEVASHISGAGLGIGAARWTAVQKDIDDRQSALFLPRGQNSTINVAFKELEAIRDDLDRTEHQPQDYWEAHESRARLAAEVAALEDAVEDLRSRITHYEKRRKARPLMERRAKLESRLKELPAIEKFPDGGIERLSMLVHQIQNLDGDLKRKRREIEERRLRRIELHSVADPEELSRRSHVIDNLRSLLPQIDAARRVYAVSTERRDAVAQEKTTLESALASVQPPSMGAFIAFLGMIWAGAAAVAWMGHGYAAIAMLAVSCAPIFWFRHRRQAAESLAEKVSQCGERLTLCRSELKLTENDARKIEMEILALTGKGEITAADIEERVAELERLSTFGGDIKALDEASAHAETEIRLIEHQVEEARRNMRALLFEGAASDEGEFIERAEIFKQRQQLVHEIDKIPLEESPTGFLFDMRAEEDAAYESAAAELTATEQRLLEARHETGRVEERISTMERSEERARALAKQETVLARIDSAAEQWAVLTLCRAMLDETRRIYETERQPEVLKEASGFFAIMTEGRYARVFAPVDGTEIQVERADGARLSPQLLSRGTAEQLYLAMRLALVREYANHVGPLPVVFDDILVNFDPQRTRSTIRAMRDLCETHQVLLFTCHPHLVQQVQEIVPSARIFPLQ